MDPLVQRSHILGMIYYLNSGIGENSDSIKQELVQACSNAERNHEITGSLAELGDADCLRAYANKHGTGLFRVLRSTSVNLSTRSPITTLGVKNAEHFARSIEVLKPAIESCSTPDKSAAEILRVAKINDCPELIAPSFEALDLTVEHARARFFFNSHTFDMKPRFTRWMVEFMGQQISPEKTGTNGFGEHIDRLLRQGDVHGVAAYIRLGYDIRPGFEHGLIKDKGNEWFNRLARSLETSHDHIEMLSKLPDLEAILTMDKTALTHLVVGKSNKEKRREAGIKKKLAQEARAKENSTS